MKEKELRVVEQEREKLKVADLFDDSSRMASEIIFPGLVLAQVGEVTVLPSLRQSNSCFGCMGTYGWVRDHFGRLVWRVAWRGGVRGFGRVLCHFGWEDAKPRYPDG